MSGYSPRRRLEMTYNTLPNTGDDRLNEQKNLPTLIAELSDPDKAVRAKAMRGLVTLGGPAVPACIPLLQDGDWKVRYRAAEALGLIGDGKAYAPLIAALGDGKDHVRYMAAKGLGLLGDPRAAAHLKAVQCDENEFVRRSAASSLGKIGGEEAVGALRAALDGETTEGVRAAILAALRDAGADGR
ncbi:HEAT repeat domain-containing protein [Methanoculleus sp. 7T]|uniref:HEAT repeat domain-containing protein n=1 Tax=Methanoculleus sp. 7T TaxID=2937282 RepID=UPI0020BD729F|nr:HEAT repeat domain-containing protein [Methanoculleus sp. 7T]MCK8519357.1 HEAT repeat domain-containing protein [Methanoculleus sp. 7T]